jgi:hypothetical protein
MECNSLTKRLVVQSFPAKNEPVKSREETTFHWSSQEEMKQEKFTES